MKVKIHRIDPTLPLPQYQTAGSFGFDFLAREQTIIAPKSEGFVPSNVIVACPEGLALLILPRSSTFRKKGLTFPHSIGLIDRDYCGNKDEIKILVYNPGEEAVIVERGERIAQGLFVETPRIEFEEVSAMPELVSRGGFGSTGGMQ